MRNSWNKPRLCLALLLTVGLAPSLWASVQTTYKWLDDQGNVTYGDHPPQGVVAEKIRISTGTSSSGSSAAATTPGSATDAGTENKTGQTTIAGTALEVSPEKALALCEQARGNLEVLENHALIRQTDENGEVKILEESEKQEQIDTARRIAADYCK